MLVVFSASHKDLEMTYELLSWCKELDTYAPHKALVVCSTKVAENEVKELILKAKECGFNDVNAIRQKVESEGPWPQAQNAMWQLANEWIERVGRCPWFWLESDAIPLKTGWLDDLEREYNRVGSPFMGPVYNWVSATRELPHLVGVSIYPPNVRRYNPFTLAANMAPWDVTRPELTLKWTHNTHLIHHESGDRVNNVAPSFPTAQALSMIHSDAVVFHRNKDGTLIARLREMKSQQAKENPAKGKPDHLTAFSVARHTVHSVVNGAKSFSHAGNIGDVIYGMFAIKKFGGGDLTICPEQRKTSPCAQPINKPQYEFIAPLLRQQEYLRNISFSEKLPSSSGVYDMNNFRNAWTNAPLKKREGLDTLAKAHFWDLGIFDRFDHNDTWLVVPDPIITKKIIIHRSPRYNSPTFPWARFIAERGRDALFVGLAAEHEKFQRDFNCRVSFWQVQDLLEMAQLIAGAKAFVGNQSSPLALAIGLGQKVIVEELERSPDCRFNRPTYTGHLVVGPDKLDFLSL
jgi:hypothetical protein